MEEQRKQSHTKMCEGDQEVNDLRLQLTTLQGGHKESMDHLSEKSRQVVALKTDLDHTLQQNQAMAHEIAMYEDTVRQLKDEVCNLQNLKKQNEQEVLNIYL